MEILVPRDIELLGCNVPEDDAPEWAADVDYSAGEQAMVAAEHAVYEAVTDSTNVYPPDDVSADAPKWVAVGPTNRWRMFENTIWRTTDQDGSIVVDLAGGMCDGVALFNAQGATARVDLLMDDVTTWTTEKRLLRPVYSYTDYFFSRPVRTKDVLIRIPRHAVVTVRISIFGSPARLGKVVPGRLHTIGGTEYGGKLSPLGFSKYVRDEYGGVTVKQGRVGKYLSGNVFIERQHLNYVAQVFSDIEGKVTVVRGYDESDLQAGMVCGVVTDAYVSPVSAVHASGYIEIEGLV